MLRQLLIIEQLLFEVPTLLAHTYQANHATRAWKNIQNSIYHSYKMKKMYHIVRDITDVREKAVYSLYTLLA